MKQTALHACHIKSGAKMMDFAGYDMPLQYEGVIQEHSHVRKSAGAFDVSHMGEFIVRGKDAQSFLQKVTSNDVSKLKLGQAQYCYFPNEKLGIVDDLLIYKLQEDRYMLVVNAANIQKDLNWLKEHTADYKVDIEDISEETSLIALQGPKAIEVLAQLTNFDLKNIPFYHFEKIPLLDGVNQEVIVSATGYTGAGGFEIYIPNSLAEEVWKALFERDKFGLLKPVGLAARDTLRLEMGYCLYGNDIDETTSPLEAGLGWATALKKDFIGADLIRKQKKEGLSQKRVGILMQDKMIPRNGYIIEDLDGNPIGKVTSGTRSPILERGIAMGYVAIAHAKVACEIVIAHRNRKAKGIVSKLPFSLSI